MAAIYGPHIINGAGPHLADLARLQPKVTLFLDPNPDDVAQFRAVCPNTICIGRIYVPDSEVEERIVRNPEEAALWAYGLILKHPARRQIHYWQIANEVCQFADKLPLIDRFYVRLMTLCDGTGDKCVVFGWSVGQLDMPANDRLALWRLVYGTCAYAEAHGHIGLLHQYGAPDLWGPPEKGGAPWLVNRLETQVLPLLPYENLKFVVGEYGIDGLLLMDLPGRSLAEVEDVGVGVRTAPKPMMEPEMATVLYNRGITGPTGWQAFTDAPGYVKQLTDMGQWLAQFSNRILGYCIFTLGNNAPWQSYDIQGAVLHGLADYYANGQPPVVPPVVPPVEPPEVPPMDVKLGSYVDGFNLKIVPFEQRPDAAHWKDGPYYRIREVFTTRDGSWEPSSNPGSIDQWAADEWHSGADWKGAGGTNNFFIKVLDKDGKPLAGKGLYYWQGPMTADPSKLTNVNQKITWQTGDENLPVWDYYNPGLGEMGKWSGTTVGRSDVLMGVDLPYKWHVSTFVVMQETTSEPTTPPTGNLELDIRNLAYNNATVGMEKGVPYNPTLAFPKEAARLNLGAPFTLELRQLSGYVVQGFAMGILYCADGDWGNLKKLTW
jgi:hypothetical protein